MVPMEEMWHCMSSNPTTLDGIILPYLYISWGDDLLKRIKMTFIGKKNVKFWAVADERRV
jgi:hypothetical protein